MTHPHRVESIIGRLPALDEPVALLNHAIADGSLCLVVGNWWPAVIVIASVGRFAIVTVVVTQKGGRVVPWSGMVVLILVIFVLNPSNRVLSVMLKPSPMQALVMPG